MATTSQTTDARIAPLEMAPDEFRAAGHALVDRISDFLASLPDRPVTTAETPKEIRNLLGAGSLPEHGTPAGPMLDQAATLLFDHSLFNGHPRFWAYITSSAAPVGALADLLAAAVNPNLGLFSLSPVATEIEAQTVRWIAELIGYPVDCGGLLVSGGNMANMVCAGAARRAKVPWDVRARGMGGDGARRLRIYASAETHTWMQKYADLFGFGTDAIRWIPVDDQLRMRADVLWVRLAEDRGNGDVPVMVVGTAGSVATGAVDPLVKIGEICKEMGIWFHVDGAYGALAAALPDASADLRGLALADSVAVDPHKWLYAPLEAGCALVRKAEHLRDAFSYHPTYYSLGEDADGVPVNYFELGPQNSRGFRALKVWLGLRQAGREGAVRMMADDCRLARALFDLAAATPEIEARTCGLSIATLRFVPAGLTPGSKAVDEYLNELNTALLTRMQEGGEAYLSNAVIGGAYCLRACIVNFRTTMADVEMLPPLVVRLGRELDKSMRPAALR
jgi:aromatic-L-amino-acid decarboxylase